MLYSFIAGIIALITPGTILMMLVLIYSLSKIGISKKNKWLYVIFVCVFITFFHLVLGFILNDKLHADAQDVTIDANSIVSELGYLVVVSKLLLGLWLSGVLKPIFVKIEASIIFKFMVILIIAFVFSVLSFSDSMPILGAVILHLCNSGIFSIAMCIISFSLGLVIPIGLILILIVRLIERVNIQKWWNILQIVIGIILISITLFGLFYREYYPNTNDPDQKVDNVYFNRGKSKLAIKDYEGAIEDFCKAIELDPKNAILYHSRGLAKKALYDFEGAIEDYSISIELDPNDAWAYNGRGIAKLLNQDFSGAIEDYSRAIKLRPKSAYFYTNRGEAKQDFQDYIGAIEDHSKAIELDPKYAFAYYNRGLAKKVLKDYNGAIEDFSMGIKLNPKNGACWISRGHSKYLQKDYHGAISDYSKAIEINPDDPEVFKSRGYAKYNLKDYNGADLDYKIADSLTNK